MTKTKVVLSLAQIEEALITYAYDEGLIKCEEGSSFTVRGFEFTTWSDECGQTVLVFPHDVAITVELS